jgi:hypothetical protein
MFAVLYCDGTDVTPMFLLDRASGSSSPVDQFIELSDTPGSYIAGDALKLVRVNAAHTALEFVSPVEQVFYPSSFYETAPIASQVMLHVVAVGAVTFPSGLTSSQGYADVAATAQTDFDVQKNGSSVGTMRFAASGTVASFIAASPITLAAGDRLKVVAPATPDATLAGIAFTLAGTRS